VWPSIRAWLFPVWCIGCDAPETALCAGCAGTARALSIHVDGITVRAAGDYAGPLRGAILALKRGERAYLDPLAALLAALVPPERILIPLPTTRRRSAERGFDQARELAARTASRSGGTAVDVLRKHGAAQRGRSRGDRLIARGRFTVRSGIAVPSRAILIDDVVTTGATLRDAAAVLRAAGCVVGGAVVVARTPAGRETRRGGRRLVEA
jgi:predicted amidophosphoribosyltransferase